MDAAHDVGSRSTLGQVDLDCCNGNRHKMLALVNSSVASCDYFMQLLLRSRCSSCLWHLFRLDHGPSDQVGSESHEHARLGSVLSVVRLLTYPMRIKTFGISEAEPKKPQSVLLKILWPSFQYGEHFALKLSLWCYGSRFICIFEFYVSRPIPLALIFEDSDGGLWPVTDWNQMMEGSSMIHIFLKLPILLDGTFADDYHLAGSAGCELSWRFVHFLVLFKWWCREIVKVVETIPQVILRFLIYRDVFASETNELRADGDRTQISALDKIRTQPNRLLFFDIGGSEDICQSTISFVRFWFNNGLLQTISLGLRCFERVWRMVSQFSGQHGSDYLPP